MLCPPQPFSAKIHSVQRMQKNMHAILRRCKDFCIEMCGRYQRDAPFETSVLVKDKKEKEDLIKMRFCAVLFAEKVAKAYDKGQGA